MITDPIADLLTRVRNAQRAGHKSVRVRQSKMAVAILELLKGEGFIESFASIQAEGKAFGDLDVALKYSAGQPCITQLKRVSTPGRRIYARTKDVPKVDCGLGLAIISTSKGLLSDREARRQKVGGEIVALVS